MTDNITLSREVAAFLCGEAALDGVWFGDKHPNNPGQFWWRKFLRAALVAAEKTEDIEALRRDAERYRWLREESKKRPDFCSGYAIWMVSCEQGGMGHNFFGEKIDAAIDAEMKEAALREEEK